MRFRALTILVALFASPYGFCSEKPEVVLTFMQFSSEEVVVYSAPESTVAAQVNWIPGQGEVPLGVSKALELARSHYQNDELASIRLAKKEYGEREVWFYIFEFDGPKQAVVLMSGDLVELEAVSEQEFFQKLRSGNDQGD